MFSHKANFHPISLEPSDEIPKDFTFPFNYKPHPLCMRAAKEVQEYISTHKELAFHFDINDKGNGNAVGKMFGVMLVRTKDDRIGYIAAFSGKLLERNHVPGFVPPIYDTLQPQGFFKQGESVLNQLNAELDHHPNHQRIKKIQNLVQETVGKYEKELDELKRLLKQRKKKRDAIREHNREKLCDTDYNVLLEELKLQSIRDHFRLKDFKSQSKQQIKAVKAKLEEASKPIEKLKETRRKISAQLQEQLHEQYNFKNARGEVQNVTTLFKEAPPSGAGECAAPKLFQFAYEHKYQPIAMAEFWWGPPPPSEVRKHGAYYPSCRRKCEPILGFMMQGLAVEPNPMDTNTRVAGYNILYEDEYLLVIDKPEGLLSVPGKSIKDSVLLRVKEHYPEAKGPILVHRLDMSTSGILLATKDESTHKSLQKQFMDRTVRKRYIAVLDGILEEDEGTIKLPLRVDLDNRPRQLVCKAHGKLAVTTFRVIKREAQQTRVYFYPHTGRTHQLRVHAAHHHGLGIPIIGDDLYGKRANRLHLHAERLTFVHPITRQKLTIRSTCPF